MLGVNKNGVKRGDVAETVKRTQHIVIVLPQINLWGRKITNCKNSPHYKKYSG